MARGEGQKVEVEEEEEKKEEERTRLIDEADVLVVAESLELEHHCVARDERTICAQAPRHLYLCILYEYNVRDVSKRIGMRGDNKPERPILENEGHNGAKLISTVNTAKTMYCMKDDVLYVRKYCRTHAESNTRS